MKKNFLVGIGVGVLVGSLVSVQILGSSKKESFYTPLKITTLKSIIQKFYYKTLKEEEMAEGIYRGYVYGLEDPYTLYLNQEEYKKSQVLEEGDYIGTGIEFAWGITSQYLIVTNVIKGSEAESKGVKVGDKIVAIDGIKTMMSNQVELLEKLTYTGETPIQYTVVDNDGNNKKEVVLTAKLVSIDPMNEVTVLENNTGYIKLRGIKDGTAKEVAEAIKGLQAKGVKKLILDIRGVNTNNPEEIVNLTDLFLEEQPIFTVKDKANKVTTYTSSQDAYTEALAVLIDKTTQGTIEAFASAIKEANRGLLVGEPTKGKGSVEKLVPLEDGTGLMITSGLLYTASDKAIKDNGIEPTILQKIPTEVTLELITKGSIPLTMDTVVQTALAKIK